LATRRTQLQQHDLLCAERDAIEATLSEQRAFKSITAQGDYGSSTEFVNLEALRKNLSQVLADIANIERQLGL